MKGDDFVPVYVPPYWREFLDEASMKSGLDRSEIVRMALVCFFKGMSEKESIAKIKKWAPFTQPLLTDETTFPILRVSKRKPEQTR